jgi:hypothetical protein
LVVHKKVLHTLVVILVVCSVEDAVEAAGVEAMRVEEDCFHALSLSLAHRLDI